VLLVYAEMCVAVIAIMWITYGSGSSHLRCSDGKSFVIVIKRWRRLLLPLTSSYMTNVSNINKMYSTILVSYTNKYPREKDSMGARPLLVRDTSLTTAYLAKTLTKDRPH